MNKRFLWLQECIVSIKGRHYCLHRYAYSFVKGSLNFLTKPTSRVTLSSSLVFSSLSSNSDRKYDSKASHCMRVLSSDFPKLSQRVVTCLITFFTSVFVKKAHKCTRRQGQQGQHQIFFEVIHFGHLWSTSKGFYCCQSLNWYYLKNMYSMFPKTKTPSLKMNGMFETLPANQTSC